MRTLVAAVSLLLPLYVLVAGCSMPPIEATDDDDDDRAESSSSELAKPGDWKPPPDVHAAGQEQYVRYDDALPWDGGANCGGRLLDGTKKLAEYLKAKFPQITYAGGYACRPNTANPSKTSVHGTGRALDLMLPLDDGEADNDVGDPIANWLVMNAEAIGVQFIIWDRASWSASRSGDKVRHYTGPHPHHDHIHVELNLEGGAGETPFFATLDRDR